MPLFIGINPKKFLDRQVITKNGKIETSVYRNSIKLPMPWSLNIPKRYERNTDLHRSKQISANINKEISRIENKFLVVDDLQKFVESGTVILRIIK